MHKVSGIGSRVLAVVALWGGMGLLFGQAARADLHENFATNPLPGSATARTTLADAADGTRFTYVTDAFGPGVDANYNSNLPTTKLLFPLGQTVNQNTSFTVSTKFVLSGDITSVPNNGMQISFGLVNSVTTGSDRPGGGPTGGNAYDLATVDYFPGVGDFGGPFLTPIVIQSASTVQSNPNGYYGAIDFPVADELNSNLPTGVLLNAVLNYDAASSVLKLQVFEDSTALDINNPANAAPDDTTIENDLLLTATQYGGAPFSAFSVDSFGINLWQDTFSPTGDSIEGDVTFHQIDVTTGATVPEPGAVALLGLGAMAMLGKRRRNA